MVVAKTDAAHRALAEQFADHGRSGALERAYLALVWGSPSRPHGTIDAAIGRHPTSRTKMAVLPSSKGRTAVTHWRVIETFGRGKEPIASLVECRLKTGRTHQVRVHLAHIGHPLIGDPLYGAVGVPSFGDEIVFTRGRPRSGASPPPTVVGAASSPR